MHLRLRFVPASDRFTVVQEHRVAAVSGLIISQRRMADPEQYWRLCDANDTVRLGNAVERLDAVVHIALPEGVTGTGA